jgi:phenylacetate-CoA ligase
MSVKVEVIPEKLSDKMSDMQALRDQINRRIQAITGIHVSVELVPPQTLERSMGKAIRVVDHRRNKPSM